MTRLILPPEDAGVLRVTLPLPAPELGKNARVHWAKRASAYAKHRELAGWVIREAMGGEPWQWSGPVLIECRWMGKGKRPDVDNATMRLAAYCDGAEDAGLIVNDNQVAGYVIDFDEPVGGETGCELAFWRKDAWMAMMKERVA